ncbi:transketolase [Acinetobacter baumannii]|uniref:transketolase n=1 Tax=Acinetobacter baumannii TaxID=470 RepID=UPI000F66621A|nr:transketolase [Acinetobacter baumannii]RSF38921.1 transketolase [Acinetobacter baumannii]
MLNVDKAGQIAELQQRAYHIRQHALRIGQVQGQGYVGQALGAADLLAVSYFHAMKYQPENPEWEGRDRFYLSIGHYAIALYAALIEAKIIPLEELETYGADDSRLPMSGMASYTPGMEITGGSLGHGLGIAVGACLGLKQRKSDAFVYNLLSDGELNEGSTWEAVMSASHWKLDNLIAIIDVNNQQADGHSSEILAFEPIVDRWQSFGWYTQRVDGNNMEALLEAFDQARNYEVACPRVIICDTKMGKGVSFLESREKTHFIRVDEHEWDDALNILTHYGQ